MSLEDGDIVRVVINQSYEGASLPIINVYWFEVTAVTGVISTPEDIAQVAGDVFATYADFITPLQSNSVIWNSAVIDNMTNLIDTGTYIPTTPVTGEGPGQSTASPVAASFKLVRSNRLTRNGSKRIGGIWLAFVDDPSGANFADDANCLAVQTGLAAPIEVEVGGGNGCTLIPVIVRRPALGLPVTVFQPIQAAQFRGWGTQNTRKRLL